MDFGIDVFQKGNIESGSLSKERIVILPTTCAVESHWNKCFVNVNICVPNTDAGKADLVKLNQFERLAYNNFHKVSDYNGAIYRYSVYSTEIIEDEPLKCHYVNVRILFEILNVK